MNRNRMLVDALRCVFESAHQAEYDLCGEQREFHLPRLKQAARDLMVLFPGEFAAALEDAKDGWGRKIV